MSPAIEKGETSEGFFDLSGATHRALRGLLAGPGGHIGGRPENAGPGAGKKRVLSHPHGEGLARQKPTYASL
jgi:hypothetical protein